MRLNIIITIVVLLINIVHNFILACSIIIIIASSAAMYGIALCAGSKAKMTSSFPSIELCNSLTDTQNWHSSNVGDARLQFKFCACKCSSTHFLLGASFLSCIWIHIDNELPLYNKFVRILHNSLNNLHFFFVCCFVQLRWWSTST